MLHNQDTFETAILRLELSVTTFMTVAQKKSTYDRYGKEGLKFGVGGKKFINLLPSFGYCVA